MMLEKIFSRRKKRSSIVTIMLSRGFSIIVLMTIAIAMVLCGCSSEEVIKPQTSQSVNKTTPVSSESGTDNNYLAELPVIEVDVKEAPKIIEGRGYSPSPEKVVEVLFPEHSLSDFDVSKQTPNLPGLTNFTTYNDRTKKKGWSTDDAGDFRFWLDIKSFQDIGRVWTFGLNPYAFMKLRFKNFYGEADLSIMTETQAVKLADSTMQALGYENIKLFDVNKLHYKKIQEKSLERKLEEEEYKKKNPAYIVYDYRLDWKEEDSKYAITYLFIAPDGIPLFDLFDMDDIAKKDRTGSYIDLIVGKDGVERIDVHSCYRFDSIPSDRHPLMNIETISAKVENYYQMRPDIPAHGLTLSRLVYLPAAIAWNMPRPETISFIPTYVCHVWLDEGKPTFPENPLERFHQLLFFNAITGEQFTLR